MQNRIKFVCFLVFRSADIDTEVRRHLAVAVYNSQTHATRTRRIARRGRVRLEVERGGAPPMTYRKNGVARALSWWCVRRVLLLCSVLAP
jgi:hypothetical protein